MCLDLISKTYAAFDNRIHVGYKVFRQYNSKIYGVYFNYDGINDIYNSDYYYCNIWYYSKQDTIHIDNYMQSYQSGFHYFLMFDDAHEYYEKQTKYLPMTSLVIKKINAKNIKYDGVENNLKVCVSDKLKIIG